MVPTMPRCVCPNVKDTGPFGLQVSEMNENISLILGINLWRHSIRVRIYVEFCI